MRYFGPQVEVAAVVVLASVALALRIALGRRLPREHSGASAPAPAPGESPGVVPDAVPSVVPDAVPGAVPDAVPGAVPDAASGSASAWWTLSAGLALALLVMTVWPAGGDAAPPDAGRRIQWVPLRTVLEQWGNADHALAVINLAGNVAVFVPLGLCLGLALRTRTPTRPPHDPARPPHDPARPPHDPARPRRPAGRLVALLLGAGVSLLAESLQLTLGTRSADVDDLLLNTLGVALGLCPSGVLAARMTRWRTTA